METYFLSEKNYELLKSLPLFKEQYSVSFDDEKKAITVSDIDELMADVNDMIVMYGMKDQNECTEYGRLLYGLYDELLEA